MEYPKLHWELNLDDCFKLMPVEELRHMVTWLKITKPKPTRKDDMARAVKSRLNNQYLREMWESLNKTQKLAVCETLHSSTRRFDSDRFKAKYVTSPKFYVKKHNAPLTLPFRFFIYGADRGGSAPFIVPLDLSEILLEFVPPPPETTLRSQDVIPETIERIIPRYHFGNNEVIKEEVKLNIREMEQAAPQDLHSVLRLIDLGKISVSATTHRPSTASVTRIAEELFGGDYFEPEVKKNSWDQVVGPMKAFAWPWLVQAGRLAQVKGSKLALTKAGKRALDTAAADTLRHLWQKWLKTRILDEFNRIEAVKGQFRGKGKRAMTSVLTRRDAVDEALSQCPVGQWVEIDDFSRFMRADGIDFEVTRNPWTLYLSEPQYGSLGYSGSHDWDLLQGRYILCLLFEYISTLGMVDVAFTHPKNAKHDYDKLWGADDLIWFSQYDGLEYFRLTPLGAYCLELTEKYSLKTAIEHTPISVFPDLRLHSEHPLSATERLTLETYANIEAENVWRLAPDKILLALENGHSIDILRDFLADRDEQPLPEKVEGVLRRIEQNADAVQVVGGAMLFECTTEKVAKELATNKHTSKLCELAGKKQLVVKNQQDKAFRKAVHDLGYGLKLP